MKIVQAHTVKQDIMEYAFFERGHLAVVTEGLRNADVVSIKGKHAYEFEIKVSKSDLDKELAAIEYGVRIKKGEELVANPQTEQAQMNLELSGLKNKAGGWSKISKHEEYIDPKGYFEKHKRYMYSQSYIPNYFYLVVPNKLVTQAMIKTEGTGYGIIAYDGCRSENNHHGYFLNGEWYEWDNKPEDSVWQGGAPCTFGQCREEVSVKRKAKKIHDKEIDDYVLLNILSRACTENIRMIREIITLNNRLKALEVSNATI